MLPPGKQKNAAPPPRKSYKLKASVEVKQSGSALRFAAENLRADKEVVLAALAQGASLGLRIKDADEEQCVTLK